MNPRRHVSAVGVVGEILVTAGVIVLLFLGWQTWWNSWVVGSQQTASAGKLSEQWYGELQQTPDKRPGAGQSTKPSTTGSGPAVPVASEPKKLAQPLAVIYVPRFGAEWKRTIREGVDVAAVLDSYDAGVGHYPHTAMPGQVGNFAVAAHDTGYGNTFLHLSELHIGDPIYIQTPDGFYTYRFRNDEYVQPEAVNVLASVPRKPAAKPLERLITLTTCNPPYHARERVVAYGVFESFSRTAPKAIATEVG